MGGADLDTLHQTAEMATAKPRERQFQVVPVPGVFTRGRWKCWDYRDDTQTQSEKRDILDFEKEKDKGDNSSDMSTTILPVSTNEVLVDNGSSYNSLSEMTNTLETTPVKERESSTIVVTSIAPAPPTPQHGTPQSMSEAVDRMNLGLDLQKGIYAQQNYSISDQMSISPVGVVSHSSGDLIGSHIVQQQIPTMSQVSSVPSNISTQSVPIVPIRPSTSEASPVEDD